MEKPNSEVENLRRELRIELRSLRTKTKKLLSDAKYSSIETKKARRENIALRKNLERMIIFLLQVLAKDNRPPTVVELIKKTGVDIYVLRRICEYFPRYNWFVEKAGLTPNRRSSENF